MLKKTIAAAAALSFAMATASFAQTSANQGENMVADPSTTASTAPTGWSAGMNSAFYTDDGVTLRPEADVRANWSKLSQAEREQVKADCAAMVNDGAADNTGMSGSAGQNGARNDQTAISQICKWTESL